MTAGLICLHYGSDYLAYALYALYAHCDEIHILYSATPSHGSNTRLNNPDSREKLYVAAYAFDPDKKIKWHDGCWKTEGEQRHSIYQFCPRADTIIVSDADEVHDEVTISEALKIAQSLPYRDFLLPCKTLWRSFNWLCTDTMCPVRIIRPNGKGIHYLPGFFWHMGYARDLKSIEYKLSIHGHKQEWRRDWFNKYKSWTPGCGMTDVHPTCTGIWNPEPFDKTRLPNHLHSHPYFEKELIS